MTIMGLRIKMKREEHHLTMAELGDLLGVQASAVNKWEKGTVSNIKRSTIQKMAEIFECDPVWLMGFEDSVEGFDNPEKFELEWTKRGGGKHPLQLRPLEEQIINAYRNTDRRTQTMVKIMLGIGTIPKLEPTSYGQDAIPILEGPSHPVGRAARRHTNPTRLTKKRKDKV